MSVIKPPVEDLKVTVESGSKAGVITNESTAQVLRSSAMKNSLARVLRG